MCLPLTDELLHTGPCNAIFSASNGQDFHFVKFLAVSPASGISFARAAKALSM